MQGMAKGWEYKGVVSVLSLAQWYEWNFCTCTVPEMCVTCSEKWIGLKENIVKTRMHPSVIGAVTE